MSYYGNKSYEGPENKIVQELVDKINSNPNIKIIIIFPMHIIAPHWKNLTPVMVECFEEMVKSF